MLSPRQIKAGQLCLLIFALLLIFVFRAADLKQPPSKLSDHAHLLPKQTVTSTVTAFQNATEGPANPDLSRFRFGSKWGHENDPILSAFSTWATSYAESPAPARSAMEPEGLALAQARRAAMKKLIQTQPKAALAYTITFAIRKELPSAIAAQLEQRVTGMGDLHVLARTSPTSSSALARRAVIHQQTYDAFVFGERASQPTSTNISLHGVALDGQIALSDSPLRAFEPGEPIPAEKPSAGNACVISKKPGAIAAESGDTVYWLCCGGHIVAAADGIALQEKAFTTHRYSTYGDRSIIVMLVDFPDLPGGPISAAGATTNLDRVANFLAQNSYGDLHLASRAITPVLRMPNTSATYRDSSTGDSQLAYDARIAAIAAGYDPDFCDFQVIAFARIGFPFSGQGSVGHGTAWVQGALEPGVLAHELGHNLGLFHANFWLGMDTPTSADGMHVEYGNDFDVLGKATNFPSAHYNANFKSLLGWLPPNNIHTATNTGVYRIYAQDQGARDAARQYGIRIPAGFLRAGEAEDYWLEFRQLFKAQSPASDSGPLVFWGNDQGTVSASRLINSHLDTGKMNSPIGLGETFVDAENGLQITPLSRQIEGDAASLDIQVTRLPRADIPLTEALNNQSLAFTTSSNAWTGQQTTSHDGASAATSGSISAGEESYLETTVNGTATVSFWWKVSSETNFDTLEFTCDGQKVAAISGEIPWRQRSFEVAAGAHKLRWTYKKDASVSGGSDRAWLDQISIQTGLRPPIVNYDPAPAVAIVGGSAQFTVVPGGTPPFAFQWSVSRNGSISDLPFATNATLTLTNIQLANAGEYFVRIVNDVGVVTSSSASLTVLPTGALLLAQPTVTTGNFTASIQPLPASGKLVIETSTDLAHWTPVSTNEISSSTFPLTRPLTNQMQFLRARVL